MRDTLKRRAVALVQPMVILSLLCHAAALLQVVLKAGRFPAPGHGSFPYTIMTGVSLVLSGLLPFLRGDPVIVMVLCLKFFLLSVVGSPMNEFMGIRLSLMTSFLLDASAHPGMPRNEIAAGFGAGLFLFQRIFLDPVPIPAQDVLSLALYVSILAVSLALIRRLRARLEDERGVSRRKDTTINQLIAANTGFQQYANVVEQRTKTNERNEITREIHDTIGHALVTILMMIKAALAFCEKERAGDAAAVLSQAQEQADTAHRQMRRELHLLRSIDEAEETGLKALVKVAKIFQEATGIRVDVEFGNLPWTLGSLVDSTLLRFLQEGLTNAHKHGRATVIRVLFWVDESAVIVTIHDNGSGADEIVEGIGFLGMRERITLLHGELEYRSTPDGFQVRARIPLEGARLNA